MNTDAAEALTRLVAAQKRGLAQGLAAVCSANGHVLDASARLAARRGTVLLVESTCNQVNQYGGYTGMTPAGFRDYVAGSAARCGLPAERLILGGDHLGPGPWKGEPAASAMARARRLVHDYVAAGYQKIHLDASMRCADDDAGRPLPKEVSVARTAELCLAAEAARPAAGRAAGAPRYIIGSEVPTPGGAAAGEGDLAVTRVEDAQETLELTRDAFTALGLDEAWERVIALVVQPGVEFGDLCVHDYRPEVATGLSRFIRGQDRLIYEVHSTDYQAREGLRQLVADQFAILKVGPALTFAFREALFALALVEEEWLGGDAAIERSNLMALVDRVMLDRPEHWRAYHQGGEARLRFALRYSYSDRVRYYWPSPLLHGAIDRLIGNLAQHPPPLCLLSQYLPVQCARVRSGALDNKPQDLIGDKIADVLADYAYATGGEREKVG